MLVSPELGRQRQADLWGSLTDQPRGCMVPEENAGDCFDLNIHTDTYAYILAHTSGPAHTCALVYTHRSNTNTFIDLVNSFDGI